MGEICEAHPESRRIARSPPFASSMQAPVQSSPPGRTTALGWVNRFLWRWSDSRRWHSLAQKIPRSTLTWLPSLAAPRRPSPAYAKDSQSEHDDDGQGAGGEEEFSASVFADGDAAPVLEATEHVLHAVSLTVEGFMMLGGDLARLAVIANASRG
jgi:hypothetical protein